MLTLMLSAWAGDAVLNLAGVDDPEAQVAAAAAVAPETLTTLTLAALAQREPRLEGGGTLTWCAAAPTDMDQLRALVDDAEKSMAYMEFETAATSLGQAIGGMGCLTQPVDPAWAARTHYLNGVTAHRSGFADAAQDSFQQALAFDPDLAWDDAFPPKAKDLFDQAKAASADAEPVTVTVQPALTVRVDGREHSDTLELAPGKHLLQIDQATAVLEVFPGTDPALIIPAAVTDIEAFDDAARQDIAVVVGPESLYVVGPQSIWLWDGAVWSTLGKTTTTKASRDLVNAEPPQVQGRLHPVTYPGIALLGIGAVAAGGARLRAGQAANAANNAESWDEYLGHANAYENQVWATQLGLGVTAAGAVLTGTGVVLTVTR